MSIPTNCVPFLHHHALPYQTFGGRDKYHSCSTFDQSMSDHRETHGQGVSRSVRTRLRCGAYRDYHLVVLRLIRESLDQNLATQYRSQTLHRLQTKGSRTLRTYTSPLLSHVQAGYSCVPQYPSREVPHTARA